MPLADPGFLAVAGAAWLLSFALHSTFLLGLTALLTRRRLPASLEQTLWRAALVGSLLTTTAISLGWDGGAIGTRIRLAPPHTAGLPWAVPGFGATGAPVPGSGISAQLSPGWTWGVLSLWTLTAGFGLVRLAGARRRLRRELGRRRLVQEGELRERLDRLCRAAGVERPVRLTLSTRLGAPIAIGHQEICLPTRVLRDLPPEELECALAHELGHLERRDPVWKGFTAALGALFFFQPLVRFARRRMTESAEFLADDWAIRHTQAEISLARCLAEVASWHTPGLRSMAGSSMAAGMADGDSPLVRRVERILGRRPQEPSPWWRGAVAIALLVVVWSLAPGVTALSPPLSLSAPDMALLPPRHGGFGPHAGMERRIRIHRMDRDTSPAPRVIVLPHERLRVRMDSRRAGLLREGNDPETLRAFLELELRMAELRRAVLLERGFLVPLPEAERLLELRDLLLTPPPSIPAPSEKI
jgi:Zn-dependent protease with chaperone function